jgi:hypothetical protein
MIHFIGLKKHQMCKITNIINIVGNVESTMEGAQKNLVTLNLVLEKESKFFFVKWSFTTSMKVENIAYMV